jgi:hypothetical protein
MFYKVIDELQNIVNMGLKLEPSTRFFFPFTTVLRAHTMGCRRIFVYLEKIEIRKKMLYFLS